MKTGWAAFVLLGGPKNAPQLLDSRILKLCEDDARQPYHDGFGTAQSDERKIQRLIRRIHRFSSNTIGKLMAEYVREHRLESAQVVVSSLIDPKTLANPHMRAHAYEGRLFRVVVVDGLLRAGLAVGLVLERDVFQQLGEALRRPVARIKAKVAALGETTKPWRAEQKVASAAAWLVLPG